MSDDINITSILPWIPDKKVPRYLEPKSNIRHCSRVYQRHQNKIFKFEEFGGDNHYYDDSTNTLLKHREKRPEFPPTPTRSVSSNSGNEEVEQATIFIQKLIRGRATQYSVIFFIFYI